MSRRRNSPTLKDVARAAQVNYGTVSRILNGSTHGHSFKEETIERVQEAARKLNYEPNRFAQSLRLNQSGMIGLSVPFFFPRDRIPEPSDEFFRKHSDTLLSELVAGMSLYLYPLRYNIIFLQRPEIDDNVLTEREIYPPMIDGLIYINPTQRHEEVFELDIKRHPMVLLGDSRRNPRIPSCDIDNHQIGYELTRHLIENGARKIAYLFHENPDMVVSRMRHDGYADALKDAGIGYQEGYVSQGSIDPSAEVEVVRRFFRERPELDGAVFMSNNLQLIVRQTLGELGRRVPEDVLLAGCTSGGFREFEQADITYINIGGGQMGYEASRMLIQQLRGEMATSIKHTLPLELSVRGSSRRLAEAGR